MLQLLVMTTLSDHVKLYNLTISPTQQMSNPYAPLSGADDLPNEIHGETKRLPGGGVVTKLNADGDYNYSYGENGMDDRSH
jgi:hypothetical protein